MDLKGSNTEKNLRSAFSAESETWSKYTFFASKARKDGYEQIARIFEETAANEKEHAEIWYNILTGGAGMTCDNLHAAASAENYEWTDMYASYADQARQEGFEQIASLFDAVGAIEREHEERYKKLIANIEGGLVFSRDNDVIWKCSNCGHIVIGKQAPEICPVCSHPKAYFEVKNETY